MAWSQMWLVVRKLVTAALVVVVATAALAAAHTSIETTRTLSNASFGQVQDQAFAQVNCLENEFHRGVPKGARIFVGDDRTHESQLLSLFATLWATPTSTIHEAQWVGSLRLAPIGFSRIAITGVGFVTWHWLSLYFGSDVRVANGTTIDIEATGSGGKATVLRASTYRPTAVAGSTITLPTSGTYGVNNVWVGQVVRGAGIDSSATVSAVNYLTGEVTLSGRVGTLRISNYSFGGGGTRRGAEIAVGWRPWMLKVTGWTTAYAKPITSQPPSETTCGSLRLVVKRAPS